MSSDTQAGLLEIKATLAALDARLDVLEDNQRYNRANFWLLASFVVSHIIQSFL